MRLFSDIPNEDRVKVPTVKTLGKNECRMSNKEFRMTKFKDFVRSRKTAFPVIPAEAGIQYFQIVTNSLDPGDPVPAKAGNRGDDFLRGHQV